MADADELAQKRSERGVYSRTHTPLTDDAERMGIAGELAFAELMGIEHTPATSAPTRGYQFNLGPGNKIKVATSRTPGNLFVKEGKVNADVYVLAGISGDPVMENVYFIGWSHAAAVKAAPVTTPTYKASYVQPVHGIPRDNLVSMKGLLAAFDINPERLHRFPLSLNGDYVVEEKERTPLVQQKASQSAMNMSYQPRPIRKPKP